MDENRRLKQISSHLMSRFPKASKDDSLEVYRSRLPAINSVLLQESYFGEFYPSLVQLRKIIASNTLFNHYNDIDISRESLRGRDLQRLAELYLISKVTPEQDKIDPFRKLYVHYALAEFDQATSTRLIVHTVLYLDTIHHLGTAKHYSYLTRGYSLQDYGCFAMTELGHGSNVAALETTATYNPVTHSFTLNSPTQTSAKW